MNIETKILLRITELENFKKEALAITGEDVTIDWFEVPSELFKKYDLDERNTISDLYYFGEIIDGLIDELQKILKNKKKV